MCAGPQALIGGSSTLNHVLFSIAYVAWCDNMQQGQWTYASLLLLVNLESALSWNVEVRESGTAASTAWD
jgi:hypothetical protein